MNKQLPLTGIAILVVLLLTACVRNQPEIIIVTATFPPAGANAPVVVLPTATLQQAQPLLESAIQPTPNPTRAGDVATQHIVQSGDTLSAIATRYEVPLQALLDVNDIENADIINVGDILVLPDAQIEASSSIKLLPDSRIVRGPGSASFDIGDFVEQQRGYIRQATDTVTTRLANGAGFEENLNAAQIVERVAIQYSVDARLLLALLEYRAGWLSNSTPREDLLTHPLISEIASEGIDRSGLYRQLSWAADRINRGYYAWKYRGLATIGFSDGTRVRLASELNAGTVALQYFFTQGDTIYQRWLFDSSPEGFQRIYTNFFGDPFANAVEPLVPTDLIQPAMQLPFEPGDTWRYTGGPHGGWGSGSAWASLDFAPPDDREPSDAPCYTSEYWVTAAASGVIARSAAGAVVIDLDGDGDEGTGWTINYLHIAEEQRVAAGSRVVAGDRIGRAACSGGFSTATHIHIGRRYNGEWLPADCQTCDAATTVPKFVLSGWEAVGIAGQEYQGFLDNGPDRVQAEQGRTTTINRITG